MPQSSGDYFHYFNNFEIACALDFFFFCFYLFLYSKIYIQIFLSSKNKPSIVQCLFLASSFSFIIVIVLCTTNSLYANKFKKKNNDWWLVKIHKKYGIIHFSHRFMYTTAFCVPVFSNLTNFSIMAYKWAKATTGNNQRTILNDATSNIFQN